MESIDLAIKPHGLTEPAMVSKEEYYPTVRLESHEPLELASNGTITFHYKKTGSEARERDGKMHYACELELHAVLENEADDEHPEEEKSDSKKTEEALDNHMSEYMKENGSKKGDY